MAGTSLTKPTTKAAPSAKKAADGVVTDAEFKAAVKDLTKVTDEVKRFAEKVNVELTRQYGVASGAKATADACLADVGRLYVHIATIERRLADLDKRSAVFVAEADGRSLG